MKQNNDLYFRRFALIGCSLVISLFVVAGSISWMEINSLGKLISTIYRHPLEVSNAALRASQSVVKMHRSMKDVVLAEEQQRLEQEIAHVSDEEKIVYSNLDIIQKLILGVEGQSLARETRKLFSAWKPIREEVINQVKIGNIITAARITQRKGADHELLLEQKMSDLTLYARHKADLFMDEATALQQRVTYITGFITIMGAFIAIIIAFFTVKRITNAFRQQKKAEEYLRESEKKFKDFVMSGTDGFVFYDSKLNLVEINDKAMEIFPPGTDKKSLIAKNILDISPSLKETGRYEKYVEVMKTGEPIYLEEIIPDPKFGFRHLSVKAFQVQKGLGFIFSDITEQLQADKKVRKLSQAVDQSASTIFITDLEGKIEFVNPSFTRITGYTKKEAIGQNPRILKSGQHPPEFYREMWHKIAGGFTWRGEMINKKKNGELYWEYATISPIIDTSGKITHYVAVKEDISERKQMEEELLQAKKDADAANQAKSEFLANMSHELRTPLNAIIGFTQVLETQLVKSLNKKQFEYFNYIKDGGNHLLEMVNDILDLSKIEAGKIETDKKPFDFGKMLERAPRIIQAVAYKKNLQIMVDIQAKLGSLHGDETRLKQVIYNLLSNAVKFTEPGKRIGINAKSEGEKLIVTVWDEGIGIPQNYLDKIFNPFEQVKGGKGSKEKGTGLGLAISKRLIELHQGTITVTSKTGEGSRFTITLPGKIAGIEEITTENSVEPNEQIIDSVKDIHVLVVEDNEINRKLIEVALDNCQLDFSESGEKAVVMTSEKEYDLILMDIQLPEMDGIEAMKQIRKNSKKHIPIIALTAFAMKNDEDKYLNEGFDNYISKPLNLELLRKKIGNYSAS